MVKLSTIIFAIYSSLAFAGCVGGCAQAEESPFAHVKTAEDAQAMIMGVAIAKAASQRCPGVASTPSLARNCWITAAGL